MAETTFTRRISIFVESGQAQQAADALLAKNEKLNATLEAQKKKYDEAAKRAAAGSQAAVKEMEKWDKSIQSTQKAIDNNNAALDRANKKVKGELNPSLNDLSATYQRLQRELKKMSEQDPGFEAKRKQVNAAKSALENYKLSLAGVREGFANLMKEAKGVAFGVLIGNTVQQAAMSIQGWLNGMVSGAAKLSDELANIEKTTGLSPSDVAELNKELGKINTRTSRSELRGLAVEAGKLGIEGVNNIKKFVQEADQIKVALGEDLGEDAVEKISKVSKIFNEGALNIASGINEIGQSSAASERYQVDFLFRMAGISNTAKLAAADVMGYSAALEINGQEVEKSSTALQSFFIDFVKNADKFGKAAGMANGELSKLLSEKGTNAAFLEFLKRLKTARPDAESMLKALEQLGIDGSRGAAVFLTLANNIGLVEQQQKLATNAIREGTSITGEFEKRNNNLAANLEKLSKHFASYIERIDLNTFAKNMVDFFIEPTEDATVALEREARQMEINLIALQDVNLTGEARKKLIEETNARYGEYLPQLITEKTTMEELKQIQIESNKQLLLKIAAMRYQKELNQILEEELQAREGIANLQINKAKAGQSGADMGLTPAQIEQQKKMIKGTEDVLTAVVNNTGKRIDNLKEKYQNIALGLSATFADIMSKLDVTGGKAAPSSPEGKGPKDPTEEEKKKAEAFQKFMEQLRKAFLLDVYDANAKELAAIRYKYEEMRRQAMGNKEALNMIAQMEAHEYKQALEKQNEEYRKHGVTKIELTKDMETKVQEVILSTREKNEKAAKDAADEWAKTAAKIQEEFNKVQPYVVQTLSLISTVFQGIKNAEDAELARDAKRNEEKKKNLEKRLKAGTISQRQYDTQIEALDKAAAKKAGQIKKEQFERDKALRISMAIVNTAAGVVSAYATSGNIYAGIALAALVAATGAAQIGIIAAEEAPEYETGSEAWRSGIGGAKHRDKSGGNPIIDGNSGRMLGKLEQGEAIIPADSTAANQPAIRWMLANRGKSLSASMAQQNMFAAGTAAYTMPANSKSTSVTNTAPGYSSNYDAMLAELKALRADMANQKKQPLEFVNDAYHKWSERQDITFRKSI